MDWKKGPLPPDTWNWGAVVPVGEDTGGGFFFADFKGDRVEIIGLSELRVLKAHEVAWFNNCIGLPPTGCTNRTGK